MRTSLVSSVALSWALMLSPALGAQNMAPTHAQVVVENEATSSFALYESIKHQLNHAFITAFPVGHALAEDKYRNVESWASAEYLAALKNKQDLKAMEALAQKGDINAQFYYALQQINLTKTKGLDLAVAVLRYMRPVAEKGHLLAQNLMCDASYYLPDHEQLMYWAERSAEQNSREGQYYLSELYIQLGQREKAVEYLKLAANQGSDLALDIILDLSLEHKFKDDKGEYLYRHYANLALQYAPAEIKGKVASLLSHYPQIVFGEDHELIIKLFEQAIAVEHPNAQHAYHYALMFNGDRAAIKKNSAKIYQALSYASEQGILDASLLLAQLLVLKRLDEDYGSLEQAEQLLDSVIKESRLQANGNYYKGILYLNKNYAKYNPTEAMKLIELAAEQQHPKAMYTCGKFLVEDNKSAQDKAKGIKLLKEACKLNVKSSCQYLIDNKLL